MSTYPKYKPSGIEWLGDIPEHWELKRFRYCFDNGKGLSITKENLKEEGIPCVNYGEIHSKYGFEVDPARHPLLCVDEEYLETNYSSLLSYSNFVFADTSEDIEGAGNFTHLDSEQNIFAGYHTVISRLKIKAHPRFIAYCIDSIAYRTQIRSKVIGVKVYSITNKILKDTLLWLPDNNEQTVIADYLDEKTSKLDQLISNKKAQIARLKEIRQIEINTAVTKGLDLNVKLKPTGIAWLGDIPEHWEVKRLKDFAKVENGKDYKHVEVEEGGYPVYGSGGEFRRSSEFIYDKPSVLLGRKGTIDKPLLITQAFWTVDTMFYTKINSNVDYRFFYYLCKTIQFDMFTYGSALPSMTQQDLHTMNFCKPDLSEQTSIANYLDEKTSKLDQLVNNLENQILQLHEVRKIEIYNAVTGKIKVA